MSWIAGTSGTETPRHAVVVSPCRTLAVALLAAGLAGGCRDTPLTGPPAGGPLAGTVPAHALGSFRLPTINSAPATISSQFMVTPTGLAFGKIQVGETSPVQSVVVTNIGMTTTTVNMAGGGAGAFGGSTSCGNAMLDPGESCTVDYRFKPTATGPATATPAFTLNGESFSVDLSGTGVDPRIQVNPIALDFGNVPVGQMAPTQAVTLTNVSTSAVTLNNLAGGAAVGFGGSQNCAGVTLNPGQSCQFSYTFQPTAIGPVSTTTTIGIFGVQHTIAFRGTGVEPRILVTPTGLDFGEVEVGQTSPTLAVVLTNMEPHAVTLTGLAGGAAVGFGGSQNCAGVTLNPGQSCQFSYTFTPAAVGPVSGTTTIGVFGVPHAIAFSGTGVGPEFLVTPTGLSFGNVPVGQTSPSQTVTVTNAGSTTVTVTFAGGAPGAPFNTVQSCANVALNPGASCQVTYHFTPTANGLATATSSFTLNGIPFAVDLSGFGVGDTEGPPADPVDVSPNPAAAGSAVAVTATLDDQATGGSDIESAEYSIDGGPWTPMSAVDQAFDAPLENVAATLTAPGAPGLYTLCVRGTDTAGNTGTPGCVTLAVYDPDGGFATGGGWFASPAGAFTDDPILTDRAHFAFVSKYQQGKTVPDGTTQFRFQAAALVFESTAYDFLIVNQGGANAQFKGSGLINGFGDPNGAPFRFIIWAGDGQPDTFRIRIWWEDGGQERTVYDNGVDQPLGGGSIMIHK